MVYDGYHLGALTFMELIFIVVALFGIFLLFLWCRRIKFSDILILAALEAAASAYLSVLLKVICCLTLFQHKYCY